MNHRGVLPIARAIQGMGKYTTLGGYAEAKAGRCQKMQSDLQHVPG